MARAAVHFLSLTRALGVGRPALATLFFLAGVLHAAGDSFNNLLARGDDLDQRGDVTGALKCYTAAEPLATNCPALCLLTRRYCDLMYVPSLPAMQKTLAERALTCAQLAVLADPKSAVAHLSLAVSYAKNFPFVSNGTKVKWSRAIKSESETGIALDPKQDVGYYLLGRWHFGVANINFLLRGLMTIVYGSLPEASNEEAIKNFQHAITLAPARIIHHFALAEVYEATGENKLALNELELCARLKPFDRDDIYAQQEAAKQLDDLR